MMPLLRKYFQKSAKKRPPLSRQLQVDARGQLRIEQEWQWSACLQQFFHSRFWPYLRVMMWSMTGVSFLMTLAVHFMLIQPVIAPEVSWWWMGVFYVLVFGLFFVGLCLWFFCLYCALHYVMTKNEVLD
ncbi:MAG: hypothetical protein HC913_15385 [Microscillaceae bacterium]|nr:hypothetical protein [Microscillaceae bacterium]